MSLPNVYCIHPLTLKRLVSLDPWNTATWSLIPFMGFMENGSKLVRNAQGEQVVSAALVKIPASVVSVTLADRIIDMEGIEHSVIALNPIYDFSFSHWEAAIT
jgi:hypothetical protein